MTDSRTRQLERQVESEPGDSSSRFALTRETLRRQKGVVAFWHGEEKPHESACKVSIGLEVKDTENRVISRPSVLGWMLAITSPADMLEIATMRGGCRLIDLETWRAVGLFGEAEAVWPEGRIQLQTATEDAWGRTRNTKVDATTRVIPATEQYGAGWALNHNALPNNVWQRPKLDEALYDREFIATRIGSNVPITTSFFVNFSSFTHIYESKQYGRDTNVYGTGSGLPQGMYFLAKGISMFFDEGTIPDVADTIKQEAAVRFRTTTRDLGYWRAKEVFPREKVAFADRLGASPGLVCEFTGSIPAIKPFSYANVFSPLEYFAVELYIPQTLRVEEAMRRFGVERVGISCVLHGSVYVGVVG